MNNLNWEKIKPFAIALLVLVVVMVIVYQAGKRRSQSKVPPLDLPNNGQGIPTGWSPDPLVKKLHDGMDGFGSWDLPGSMRVEAWNELADLQTPDMVVAVNNRFNQLHGADETLYEWIDSELATTLAAITAKQAALHTLQSIPGIL